MFGYLIASAPELTPEELERYKSCYCGLCRCLGQQHGSLSRLTLNYDMTFLVLLLESLYDCEETKGSLRCIAHPGSRRDYWQSDATIYASDMLIILSYFKCIDDWNDDSSLTALLASKAFKSKIEKLKEIYPRQFAAISQSIFELSCLENEKSDDADAAASTFGHLMGEIFVWKEDRWSKTLYNMGDALGRFIYLVDAAVDLDKDKHRDSFNPFLKYYGQDNYSRFKEILKLFLADAIVEFEKLPLVDDVGIMKNILCSGLWARFEEKYGSVQSAGSKSRRQ